MAKNKVIRGKQKILGSLGSGTGQPILTKDPSSGLLGQVNAIDPSVYISTTLASGKILIGNASNIATAVTPTGSILISNTGVTSISPNVIIDANINTAAAIQYSKLSLANSIVNNDIATAANITRSKLVAGTANVIVINNAAGVMSEVTPLTAARVLVTDFNGLPTTTAITTTNLSSLDTSISLTTQLSNKLSFSSGISPAAGDLISYISGVWNRVPLGTAGQYLVVNGGGTGVAWTTVPNGVPSGGTTHQFLAKNTATNFDTSWYTMTTSLITDITITAAAINSLNNWINSSGNATGSSGQALTIVGGLPTWTTLAGTGTVTSIAVSGGTTGLTTSGGPITSSGTVTLAGTLVAVNGGTGQSAVATGDILYGSAVNTWSRLTVGTNGYVLSLVAGLPAWVPAGAGDMILASAQTSTGKKTFSVSGAKAGVNVGANAIDPTTTLAAGDMYYQTAVGVRVYDGASWSTVGGGANPWLLGSGGTLTGVNTITSNAKNQLIFTGTFTASAATDNLIEFGGSLTASSSGGVKGIVIDPLLTASGTSSVQIGLDVAPTFSGGTTPINIAARFQGVVSIGTGTALFASPMFQIRNDQNANTKMAMINATSGASASTGYYTSNDGTTISAFMTSFSAGFSTSNSLVASGTTLACAQSGGWNISTTTAAPITFWTNSAKRIIIDGSGNISTGSTTSAVFRTTNAGSDVIAHFLTDPASSLTAGAAYGFETANGFVFTQGNGTRRIAFGAIKGVNLTSTANSEAGGLGFFTQTGGSAIAQAVTINPNGRTFFGGSTSATALVHLAAGTATASTAPLKFTSGTNLGTIESGAMEYDGTHLYFSIGSTRYQLDQQGGGSGGWAVTGSTTITGNTNQTGAFNNTFNLNNVTVTQNAISSLTAPNALTITGGAHTNLTASTPYQDVLISLNRTIQFATGGMSTYQGIRITPATIAFVGSSTLVDASTLYIAGNSSAGTNATITNSHGLNIGAVALSGIVTNSYALTVNAMSGATNNYAAQFLGNIVVNVNARNNSTIPGFKVVGNNDSNLPASTEVNDVSFSLTRQVQWATGALALQRAFVISAPTYAFIGASTLTDAATVGITGAPVTGTSATFTNTHALLISSSSVAATTTPTNSFGITVNAMTGATNNYVAQFTGGLGILLNDINIVLGTTTGTMLGSSSSQKLGVWGATPIVQPTTGVAAGAFVANSGTAVNDASTFDGYTLKQIVKALRNLGLLA